MINLEELKKLAQEYLETLDDSDSSLGEFYLTKREFGSIGVENFIEWLEKKLSKVK